MKSSVKIQGGTGLLQKYKAHPQLLNREIESVLKQEARALCVEYASATMPGPGLQDGGKVEAFRKTINSDVRRVFASRANPNWIGQTYAMIKAIHSGKAKQFLWLANNKPESVEKFLKGINLPKGLDPTAHKAARTGKNGRVGRMVNGPVSIAPETRLNAYSKKQQALAGFAKAGWGCAAKGLGGRIRRNIRDANGGNRRTAESLPKYIRTLMRKFPDSGGARIIVQGSRVQIEIFTNVKHAVVAMPKPLYEAANSRAQQKTSLALAYAVQQLNRSAFKAG